MQLLQNSFSNAASHKAMVKKPTEIHVSTSDEGSREVLFQACDLPHFTLTWQRCILATAVSWQSKAHIFACWTWRSATLWAPAMTFFSWWAHTAPWSSFRTALTFIIYLFKPKGPYATRALPAHQIMIWSHPCIGDQSQQSSSTSELPSLRNTPKDSRAEPLPSSRIRCLLASNFDAHGALILQTTSEFEPLLLKLTEFTFQLVGSQAEGTGPCWFTNVSTLKACTLSSPKVSSLA